MPTPSGPARRSVLAPLPAALTPTADGGAACWLLVSGAMRLDLPVLPGQPPQVQLAMPGDLIGYHRLCGQPATAAARSRALTRCRLQRLEAGADDPQGRRLLDLALLQHWRRTVEMESLRSRGTSTRVRRLLQMLEAATGGPSRPLAARDAAALVDAPLRSVARALESLQGGRPVASALPVAARPAMPRRPAAVAACPAAC